MLRVFIVVGLVLTTSLLTAFAATAKIVHAAKITIIRMEEPDLVREIQDLSLLRLVKEEKLPERGFKRVTIQRSDGTRFTLDLSVLEKKDFALNPSSSVREEGKNSFRGELILPV